jgi:hypothetical protein
MSQAKIDHSVQKGTGEKRAAEKVKGDDLAIHSSKTNVGKIYT